MHSHTQMRRVTIDSCSHSCSTHILYMYTQAAKRMFLWGLWSSCTLHPPRLVLENVRTVSQAAAVTTHSELWVYYTGGDDCKPTLSLQSRKKTSSRTLSYSPFNISLMIFSVTSQKAYSLQMKCQFFPINILAV